MKYSIPAYRHIAIPVLFAFTVALLLSSCRKPDHGKNSSNTSEIEAPFLPYQGEPLDLGGLKDLTGQPIHLDQYRGSVVLVNLWTTWCAPCVGELPSLQSLHTAMKVRPFALVAINMGEKKPNVAGFLKRWGYDFTVVLDPRETLYDRWHVENIPTTFLLAPDGKPRYIISGSRDWNSPESIHLIESLMKKQ